MQSKIAVLGCEGPNKKIAEVVASFLGARGFHAESAVLSNKEVHGLTELLLNADVVVVAVDCPDIAFKTTEVVRLARSTTYFAVWAIGSMDIAALPWSSHGRLLMPISSKEPNPASFELFVSSLWKNLELVNLGSSFPQSVSVSVSPAVAGVVQDRMAQIEGSEFKRLRVLENKVLTAEGYDRPSNCMTLDLKGTGITYSVGDFLTVLPENTAESVQECLELLNLSGEESVTISPAGGKRSQSKVCDLLKYVLDIQGKATRKFMLSCSLKATNRLEAAALEAMALDMSKDSLYAAQAMGLFSYIDVLKQYPSVKLSIADFVNVVPSLRYRSYSCSSSPLHNPDQAQCTFVLNKFPVRNGVFQGLSSSYLAGKKAGEEIVANIRALPFPLDLGDQVRWVGVALGSGVALLRGISQHFYQKKLRGEPFRPLLLYYGVRHEKKDFIYSEEFYEYEKAGVLTFVPSFSHDDPKQFITPATKIKENPGLIAEYLLDPKARFLYCGPAGPALDSIKQAVMDAVETHTAGKVKGQALIDDMSKAYRWNAYGFLPRADPENIFH